MAREFRKVNSSQVAEARERLLSHQRTKAGADSFDETELLKSYAGVFESSRAADYVAAIICADEHGLGIATDDIGLAATENRVSIPDWHATMLHCLGLDHEQLVYKRNGLEERLTSVFEARVVKEILK